MRARISFISRWSIERLHLKNARKNCLTTVAIRPYLGAISMGAIGANVTLFARRVPHYEHHCQTLGQGWEQTYKLD